jgi:hypothetical protein
VFWPLNWQTNTSSRKKDSTVAEQFHEIQLSEISRLYEALESSVEMITDYGKEQPDWQRIIDDVEQSEDGLDLGTDMDSPVIKALLKRGRQIYRELRET